MKLTDTGGSVSQSNLQDVLRRYPPASTRASNSGSLLKSRQKRQASSNNRTTEQKFRN